MQFSALDVARQHAVRTANQGMADVQESIVQQINSAIANASSTYAHETNSALAAFELDMNQVCRVALGNCNLLNSFIGRMSLASSTSRLLY